ncbi:hypothetical protein KY290_013562 [Solanum tuberosum]|uniref:Uncharacterized protein n=1 Tax=Solanum tuberosum TaxID=4113 RepID=A0ABQ7VM24_SOLTU|nr:hypothetical protein KY289_013680 [Solanum tuberosum]KAH0717001.1 hypothetical protein KY285_013032 [Solanum tuberosum]KAH0769581.1 hypothetical protein KY290_013562 [Solanum tuberosum]
MKRCNYLTFYNIPSDMLKIKLVALELLAFAGVVVAHQRWSFAVARWPELLVTLALLLRRGISGGYSLIGGRLPELLLALARLAASCCCLPVRAVVCRRRSRREKEATGRGGEERTTPGLLVTAAASHRKWMENEREEEVGRR